MKILFFLILIGVKILAFDPKFKTFSSDFLQRVDSKSNSIEYKGNFILTQNQAFWNYTYPSNKQIYIQNNEIIIIEHDLEQAIFAKLQTLPNLSKIFKQATKIDTNLYEAKYQNITYKITLENDEIKSISYQDELENIITIVLNNVKRDEIIDKQIFEAKIPPHYDTIY
ncbi:LolA-like outer membrane lipoprotein chaperone [Campylobacter sp. US33a]|uniref:LolA-like outer membrane lipoprotein chaperone n=1 Tax=Campylobacter sp. US33a TaxID=2498120 RepID=UPI001067FFE5|nr:LolA-like outer membrane lipoprotein chaperone [Campylobacter sp. US33a]TEY03503.1 outer membrane lipoprotein chaperone LolA [Campylobacter sp. US33a]